jgi:hypothetical protein
VWDGHYVRAGVPLVLSFGSPGVAVTSPAAIAGPYQFGSAAFGPRIGDPDVLAPVVAAVDDVEVGGTSTDGCSPLNNAAEVVGRIFLIERHGRAKHGVRERLHEQRPDRTHRSRCG